MSYRRKGPMTSPRLPGFDYATPGVYFITICTKNRICHFGEILNGQISLSSIGEIVQREWLRSGEIRSNVMLDEWVIMPNHFHALVWFTTVGISDMPDYSHLPQTPGFKRTFEAPSHDLGGLIRGFKGGVTRVAWKNGYHDFAWQSRYHDRIVRNEDEFYRIRTYIRNNPIHWNQDEFYAYP